MRFINTHFKAVAPVGCVTLRDNTPYLDFFNNQTGFLYLLVFPRFLHYIFWQFDKVAQTVLLMLNLASPQVAIHCLAL